MFGQKKDITIEVGRTVCINFQSKSVRIQLNVPNQMDISKVSALGNFMVDAQIFGTWERGLERRFATDYTACFGGDINEYLDFCEKQVDWTRKDLKRGRISGIEERKYDPGIIQAEERRRIREEG